MKKILIIAFVFFFPICIALLGGPMPGDVYTIDGEVVQAIEVAFDRYCVMTTAEKILNNYEFSVKVELNQILVDITVKGPVLGGIGRFSLDRKTYKILQESYHP
ncbi:hypothetical protein WKV44_10525 [Spirochaetia bacterium 38H-sp]|uniref:DUF4468 domain-containing protein n=1 Tax=Rarispira pelagica TaxID=3141764 RepID=A0ABU9UG57_9SPIR